MPPAPGTLITCALPMPAGGIASCMARDGLVPAAAGRGGRHDRVVRGQRGSRQRQGERRCCNPVLHRGSPLFRLYAPLGTSVRGWPGDVGAFAVPMQSFSLESFDSDDVPMPLTRRAFLVLGTAAALSGCTRGMSAPPARRRPAAAQHCDDHGRDQRHARATTASEPLTYNNTLERAARTHANLMASRNTLSHTLGGTPPPAGHRRGLRRRGRREPRGRPDDARGRRSQGWLNSRGHRSTLLSPNFKEFGLAAARSVERQDLLGLHRRRRLLRLVLTLLRQRPPAPRRASP